MLRRVRWRLCAFLVTLMLLGTLPASAATPAAGSSGSTGTTKQLKVPAPLKQLPAMGPFQRTDLFRPLPGTRLDPNIHQSIWDPESPTGRLLQPKSPFPQRRGPDPALHGRQGGPAQIEAIRKELAAKALAADRQNSKPAPAPGKALKGTAVERELSPGEGLKAGATQHGANPAVDLIVKRPPAAPIYKQASGTVKPASSQPETPGLTLTPELLRPDTDVTVNVTVTEGGVPTPDAWVTVGSAIAKTDEDGKAVLHFHTGPGREVLDVQVETPLYKGVAGELYVVPAGAGVVTVAGVTDKTGAPIEDLSLITTWYDNNWWTAWATWGKPMASAIMPTGTNHLEITANVGTTSYYLYQTAEVKEMERTVLDLNTSGTVHLTTTAQLDGTAVTGSLALHNEALFAAPSWAVYAYPIGPDAYVTPGTYAYSFLGDNQPVPLLVSADGVTLAEGSVIAIQQKKAKLGTLALPATDGKGDPLTLDELNLFCNPFIRAVPGKTTALLVSPDTAYSIWDYAAELVQGSDVYDYDYWSYAGITSPAAGRTETIALGGPVTATLQPAGSCSGSGCVFSLYVGLDTAVPDQFSAAKNGDDLIGLLSLKDSSGNALATYDIPTSWRMADITLPALNPGVYTMQLTYPLGPYQDPVSTEITLDLSKFNLSISPRVIQPETPTDVEVVVTTAAGLPLPDTKVIAGWYGELGEAVTDARGRATLTLEAPYVDVIPIQAMDDNGWNPLATGYLFALTPAFAGLELNALDEDGKPLENYWVHTSYLPGGWDWDDWVETGPVPAIVPGDVFGDNFVELIREGNPAYFLSQTGSFRGGVVTNLTWSAAEMEPTYFTVGLDGEPLQATVALHGKMNHSRSGFDGLYLDEYGQGVAYVAPAQYDVKIQQQGPENILAIRRNVMFNQGEAIFNLKSEELGTLETKVLASGQEEPHAYMLNSREFENYFENAGVIRTTPDTFAIPWIAYLADQPTNGETWQYSMARTVPMTVTVQAGKTATYDWDATVKQGKMAADPMEYSPWDFVWFQLQPTTADRWYYDGAWLAGDVWEYRGLPQITITDAAGNVQEDYEGNAIDNYFFVPEKPTDFYTITMKADLGVAGKITSNLKLTRQAPTVLTVNTEILPVGKSTALVVTLSRGGKPLKNEWVSLMDGNGNSIRDARTNDKGQATITVKPQAMDYYALQATNYAGMKFLYALDPGWGVLDVRAEGKDGEPMVEYEYVTLDNYVGYNSGPYDIKAIVPAGPTKAIVYGYTENAQYYLTTEAQVPDRSIVTVRVDGTQAAPLTVNVTSSGTKTGGILYLRNKAFDYIETTYMPYNLWAMSQVYATPGDYEAMVRVSQSWDLYLVNAGDFNLPAVKELNLDLAQATAELVIDSRDGNGNTAETDVLLRGGNLGTPIWYYGYDQIFVTPGSYSVEIADLYVYDFDAEEAWLYEFVGHSTAEAKAGGTAILPIGGPLTATIKLDQPIYAAGDKVKVFGAATANNMVLDQVISTDYRVEYYWPNFGAVVNSSSQLVYLSFYFGDTWTWPTPNKAGTYTIYFLRGNGPYGPESDMQTTTWLNLGTRNK